MRKSKAEVSSGYKFMLLDDETGIIDSLSVVMKRNCYNFIGFTDPVKAISRIREEQFDLLILDYLMEPYHGDEVVARIREFDKDIYIILLTGHKDLAPPLETIRTLDIQGYCEKSDKFDQLILLIESAIKSISRMRTIKHYKDSLKKMVEAIPEVYQLKPVSNIIEGILSGLTHFYGGKDAFILLDEISSSIFYNDRGIFKGLGRFNVDLDSFMSILDTTLIDKIGYARAIKKPVLFEEGVVIPLVNELSNSIGVIYLDFVGSEDSLKLLEIYSKQAASSISNAFLHCMLNVKNDELNSAFEELKNRYLDTIEVLRMAVDAKDVYSRGHSERVAYYAVKIGEAFGLSEDELELLRLGGIFHDVGKIGTADDILFKTDNLDLNEYDEIKKHTLKGAHILSAVSMFKKVVPLVKYHHERIDGNGYPEGLAGEDIPFLVRVLSVADAFDSMTSDRYYRMSINIDQAVSNLLAASGTQFDNEVVNKFVELLKNFDKMKEELKDTFK